MNRKAETQLPTVMDEAAGIADLTEKLRKGLGMPPPTPCLDYLNDLGAEWNDQPGFCPVAIDHIRFGFTVAENSEDPEGVAETVLWLLAKEADKEQARQEAQARAYRIGSSFGRAAEDADGRARVAEGFAREIREMLG